MLKAGAVIGVATLTPTPATAKSARSLEFEARMAAAKDAQEKSKPKAPPKVSKAPKTLAQQIKSSPKRVTAIEAPSGEKKSATPFYKKAESASSAPVSGEG